MLNGKSKQRTKARTVWIHIRENKWGSKECQDTGRNQTIEQKNKYRTTQHR